MLTDFRDSSLTHSNSLDWSQLEILNSPDLAGLKRGWGPPGRERGEAGDYGRRKGEGEGTER